jgi:hypothetical protein
MQPKYKTSTNSNAGMHIGYDIGAKIIFSFRQSVEISTSVSCVITSLKLYVLFLSHSWLDDQI